MIILMTIILYRFKGPYHQGDLRDPQPYLLINPTFLRILDDMFYRVLFSKALQLELLLKKNALFNAANAEFLASIREKLDDSRAVVDFGHEKVSYGTVAPKCQDQDCICLICRQKPHP